MIRWYFAWVSRLLTAFENWGSYPVWSGGRLRASLATVLVTLPIWSLGVVIYNLPFSEGVKFNLWILLLITTIIYALRTAYVLSRKNNRKH